MKKSYLIGVHELGIFPDILLTIEHKKDYYELPFGPRIYSELTRNEFLKMADGFMEIRNIKQ